MFSLIITLSKAIPHQQSYGKEHPRVAGPPSYTCNQGFILDGKKCFQEFFEPVVKQCPVGFQNAGTDKELNCVQIAERVGDCPPGSVAAGKNCMITEAVPAIPFCPAGYSESGKGCTQLVQLPIVQKCDVGKLVGKQCMLEDRAELNVEVYCPAGYVQVAKGCQKTVMYDCTRPRQSKKGVGASVGGVVGRPYRTEHYGHNYGGGYYASGHKHLRLLGKKKHDDVIFDFGKDVLPPPVVEIVSKQCERIEYAKPESRSFCPPGYNQNGKGCVKLIVSEPRSVCSNGASAKSCTSEKFAPLQHQCPKGYGINGKKCTASKNIPMIYRCPPGFFESGKGCQKAVPATVSCPPGTSMRGSQCVGKRFSEPIVTQQISCVGKGCNEL